MKVKIVSKTLVGDDLGIVENEVNKFIKDKEVIDRKYMQHLIPTVGNRVTFLIMYK